MGLHLAWHNLMLRKVRTVISILAVAVGIMTLLVVRGMAVGTVGEVVGRMQSIKADLLVFEGSPAAMMVNRGMDLGYADLIRQVPGVTRVVPVLHETITMMNQEQKVYAVPMGDFDLFGSGNEILAGRMFENNPERNEIVIDSKLAAGGYGVGQVVEEGPRKFHIVGVIQQGVAGRVFMSYETARRVWFSDRNLASMLVVKVDDPQRVDEVQSAIRGMKLEADRKSVV